MNIKMFFQLIRWKNLLLGVTTLALIKFILIPHFLQNSILSNLSFSFFVLSVFCISAGGYIINDIIDKTSDLINKPNKTIIGIIITKETATKLYLGLYFIGLSSGIYMSISTNQWYLSVYFISLTIALQLYSKLLKPMYLIGNIVVSIAISSSILILPVFEKLKQDSILFKIIIIFGLFAFFMNLIREIVKDIEDINGDFVSGHHTLPIIIGRKRANRIVLILSILLSIFIVIILILNRNLSSYLFLYGIIGVLVPFLYFIYKLEEAKSKQDYQHLSLILKYIMSLGILSIFTL